MIESLRQWILHRRVIRRRWQEETKRLAAVDPVDAYYEAQRRAARNRAQGDPGEHWHWPKVASEVARIEPRAAMDFEVVKAISDQDGRTGRKPPGWPVAVTVAQCARSTKDVPVVISNSRLS